jgi:hypothetical protein
MTDADAPTVGRRAPLVRRGRDALPLDRGDRPWLALALLPGVVAVATYLATNPYPASGAGLYAKIAAEIVANGYAPPTRIPGYTADGVPFAYPPLQFYVFAALLDLGADPVSVARLLPGVGLLAALVPLYLLARDVSGSRPAGAAAAALVALNPQILQWHVTAGGVVRAFALLYALTAVYAGYHVFATADRRALVLGALAVGATLLTHPTYSLFAVATYLLLWAVRDRSAGGLVAGALVGVGGAALAGPWLAWVAAMHGVDVFAAAAGTHGGVGGGAGALAGDVSPALLVPLAGAAYLLARRRPFLPAWLVAAELLFKQPRFAYVVAAVLVPVAAVALARRADDAGRSLGVDADWRAVAAAAVVVLSTLGGGVYLAHEMTLAADPSTPEFLDSEAVEAMEWVAADTDEDATFVVVGDAAEWFPALTGRTVLVGPWGVEWEDARAFERQITAYERLSTCKSAACVEGAAAAVGASPDYVYVPKGSYTVRGATTVQFGTLERSFERSPRWERAYENDGVVVYRAAD